MAKKMPRRANSTVVRRQTSAKRSALSSPPAQRRPPAGSARGAVRSDARQYQRSAQRQLRRFRQGSALAVALTALLLMLWGQPVAVQEQPSSPAAAQSGESVSGDSAVDRVADPSRAVSEAASTIRELLLSLYGFLPRLILVLLLVGVAALASRLLQTIMRRAFGSWERGTAAMALTRLIVYLLALVASISVLAGDVRAIVGSVGLLGLAASWALQTPIESFTGWLLNSFRGYYRVGDRIAVGDVFGDVYRIDILTTTVWEAGGRGKPVSAAQPTGAMITFPNWEVLRSNIVNYSHVFPYVWDELTLNVANESDLAYTARVLEDTARRVLGDEVAEAAAQYQEIPRARTAGLRGGRVEEVPRVYLSPNDSWTDCTIRYVVPVRTRRKWSSALVLATAEETARPEHIRPHSPGVQAHGSPSAPRVGLRREAHRELKRSPRRAVRNAGSHA
jgi:small conductance mechanosensitive channel